MPLTRPPTCLLLDPSPAPLHDAAVSLDACPSVGDGRATRVRFRAPEPRVRDRSDFSTDSGGVSRAGRSSRRMPSRYAGRIVARSWSSITMVTRQPRRRHRASGTEPGHDSPRERRRSHALTGSVMPDLGHAPGCSDQERRFGASHDSGTRLQSDFFKADARSKLHQVQARRGDIENSEISDDPLHDPLARIGQ